jgi:hypothetical protein
LSFRVTTHEQAQHDAGHHDDPQQRVAGERLAHLEVGEAARDL